MVQRWGEEVAGEKKRTFIYGVLVMYPSVHMFLCHLIFRTAL